MYLNWKGWSNDVTRRGWCQLCYSAEQKDISSTCLICRFAFDGKGFYDHYWKESIFCPSATLLCPWSCAGFTVLFKDTSAGWCLLPKALQPGLSTLVEGQALCSLRHLDDPNKHARAKQPDGKSSQARQQTEVEHLLQGCIQAHSGAQDKSCLTFPAAASSDSDLAKRYRWDHKCPLDTAIKFHFEIMHAKVSLNPSQR